MVIQKRTHTQKGFTLVELLIAATLSVFLFAALTSTLLYMAKSEIKMSERLDMKLKTDLFLSYFNRDVLMSESVALDETDASYFNLTTANFSSGAFSQNDVEYSFDQKNGKFSLMRTAGGNSKVLLENVTNYSINYLDFNRDATTDEALVCYIQISADIEQVKGNMTFTKSVISPELLMRNKTATN
ncbi:PilW family protein [Coraliomargarita akajimensis]|nr:prepilin-type N-terminal cleavage/methylation domain-containing protein [Coraliomargarita akajimensis]